MQGNHVEVQLKTTRQHQTFLQSKLDNSPMHWAQPFLIRLHCHHFGFVDIYAKVRLKTTRQDWTYMQGITDNYSMQVAQKFMIKLNCHQRTDSGQGKGSADAPDFAA